MLRRIFKTESQTVTGAALLIGFATLASRVVGLIRDRVFAHNFPVSPVMDAYFASFKIPDLIYNLLIVGALTAGFIPTFTKMLMREGERAAAWRLANNVVNIVGIVMIVLSGLGVIFMPQVVGHLFPGFNPETRNLTISFTRIMFLSPLILGISMVLGGVVQSLRQFFTYSLAPVLYNLGIIFGALIFVPLFGYTGLAWGVVLGALLHLAIQSVGAYMNGYRWQWVLDLKDKETREIGRLMLPRTISLGVTQINNIIVAILASLLIPGSVAIYNYADNLHTIPTGLIAIPFALAVFPILSAHAAENNRQAFVYELSATARKILFLIVPTTIVMLLLRAQIVRVVYGTGLFDWNATIATANTLAFFALGLIGQALIPLLARAFFSLSDSKTPLIIGIITELITIIFSLLLMRPLGVAGLALASALGDIVNMVLLVVYLRQVVKELDGHANLVFAYKVSAGAIAMAVVMQILKYPLSRVFSLDYFSGVFLQGLISGIAGIAVYGLACHLLRIREMTDVIHACRKKWMRFWNITEGITETERL